MVEGSKKMGQGKVGDWECPSYGLNLSVGAPWDLEVFIFVDNLYNLSLLILRGLNDSRQCGLLIYLDIDTYICSILLDNI